MEHWSLLDTTTEIPADRAVGVGSSIFFVRSSDTTASSSTTLTFAGGVVDISSIKNVDVAIGETKLICNPWPIGMKISAFNTLFSTGSVVGNTDQGLADQIWTYSRAKGWKKYFYYKKTRGGVVEHWSLLDSTDGVTDEDTIDAGAGFFFVRSSDTTASSACVLSFKGPDYKGE